MAARSTQLFAGPSTGFTQVVYTCPPGKVVLVKWASVFNTSGTPGYVLLLHYNSTAILVSVLFGIDPVPTATVFSASLGAVLEPGDQLWVESTVFPSTDTLWHIAGAVLDK